MIRVRPRCHQRTASLLVCSLVMGIIVGHVLASEITVTLIGPFGNWGDELTEALTLFSEKTQGVKAELLITTDWNATMSQAATMTAGGVAPDLLYGSATPFHYYALNHMSQPIDSWVARDIDTTVYPESVLDAMRLGGSLYGLPTAVSPSFAYYNVDRFNEVGLDMLPVRWASEAFDWDDFVTILRKLTCYESAEGPSCFGSLAFGRGGGWNRLGMWGLDLFDPDMTEFYGNRPEVIEAMEKFATLWTTHGVIGGRFMSGTAGMTMAHADVLNQLIQQQRSGSLLNWSVGVLPKGTKRLTYTAFHGIGLSAQTPHPEEAWQLLKFLTYEPEGAVLFARAENRIPLIPATTRDFMQRFTHLLPRGIITVFTESPVYAYDAYLSRHPNGAHFLTLLDRELARPTRGEVSVQQVMNEIEPVIRALLKER
ncbi:MAG: extracellular solute-binding protein [Firmicutes bacterium]|nr:extracellular solute-binding protein [Bacillota bacterium]